MADLVYIILGRILPKKLLKKWAKETIGSFKYNVADYAPAKKGIM